MQRMFAHLPRLAAAFLHGVFLMVLMGTLSGFRRVPTSGDLVLDEEDYARFAATNRSLTSFLGVELYPTGPLDWGPERSCSEGFVTRMNGGCRPYKVVNKVVTLAHPIAGMTRARLSSAWNDFDSIGVLEVVGGGEDDVGAMVVEHPFDLESERRWVLAVAQEIRACANIELQLVHAYSTCVYAYGESLAVDGKNGVLSVYVSSAASKRTCGMLGEEEEDVTLRHITVRPLARRERAVEGGREER